MQNLPRDLSTFATLINRNYVYVDKTEQIITLLLQTGYLTIKDYDKKTNKFILDYPNDYVEEAFKRNVIEALVHTDSITIEQTITRCQDAFNTDDKEKLKDALQNLFKSIRTPLTLEIKDYFYILFKFLFSLLNTTITSETFKQKENILALVKTKTACYKITIIFNGKAELPAAVRSHILKGSWNTITLICTPTEHGITIAYK